MIGLVPKTKVELIRYIAVKELIIIYYFSKPLKPNITKFILFLISKLYVNCWIDNINHRKK